MKLNYKSIESKEVEKSIEITAPEYRKDALSVYKISVEKGKPVMREIFRSNKLCVWVSIVKQDEYEEVLSKETATAEDWDKAVQIVTKMLNAEC